MSGIPVTVVDYGIGNLFSVRRALESCGGRVQLTSDRGAIEEAERLVLPGVGAFADGMQGLRERGLTEAVVRVARSGRPFLGICLGMQMLATVSEEFGEHAGLDVIPGRVVPVPRCTVDGRHHKIPHIGWTPLSPAPDAHWGASPLNETEPGTAVYLVHSFHVLPDDPAHLLASCEYGGHAITASIAAGKVFGCQFHPEKSGAEGLRMLHAFLKLR